MIGLKQKPRSYRSKRNKRPRHAFVPLTGSCDRHASAASQASELSLQQSGAEQRRLLQTVIQKAAWQNGALRMMLFEPFQILRHSNQESYRREKEVGGSEP